MPRLRLERDRPERAGDADSIAPDDTLASGAVGSPQSFRADSREEGREEPAEEWPDHREPRRRDDGVGVRDPPALGVRGRVRAREGANIVATAKAQAEYAAESAAIARQGRANERRASLERPIPRCKRRQLETRLRMSP